MSIYKLENNFIDCSILLHSTSTTVTHLSSVENMSSYVVEYWNCSVVDCDAVQPYSNVPKLRTILLPQYTSPKTEHTAPQHRYLSA